MHTSQWIIRCALSLLLVSGAFFTAQAQIQRPDIPLHRAGELYHSGEDFDLFGRDFGSFVSGEHCEPRNGTFWLSAVFDVADDFQLDRAYLESVLPLDLLNALAAQHCPAATKASVSVFLTDRYIGKRGAITDAPTIRQSGGETHLVSQIISLDGTGFDSFNDDLGLVDVSWNGVLAFNDRGLRSQAHADAETQRQNLIAAQQRQDANLSAARNAWFEEQKTAYNWRGKDDWVFDTYRQGRGGIPAPPALSRSQREAWQEPREDQIVLAFVERAHRQCGRVSPNGTVPLEGTVIDQSSGAIVNQETIYVDRRMEDLYLRKKNAFGTYTPLTLLGVNLVRNELDPIFDVWACDSAEFDHFITGILKRN